MCCCRVLPRSCCCQSGRGLTAFARLAPSVFHVHRVFPLVSHPVRSVLPGPVPPRSSLFPVASGHLCISLTPYISRRSEPYDPYVPRDGQGQPQGNNKTAAIQAQIDDTVGIMRDNIVKVRHLATSRMVCSVLTGPCPLFLSHLSRALCDRSLSVASVSTRCTTRPTTWQSAHRHSARVQAESGRCVAWVLFTSDD